MEKLNLIFLNLISFLQSLAKWGVPSIGINFLDIIILFVVAFYVHEGYLLGLTLASMDLGSFILSFIIALKFYALFAKFLTDIFLIPIGFANAASFFIIATILEILFSILFRKSLKYLPTFSQLSGIYKYFKKN